MSPVAKSTPLPLLESSPQVGAKAKGEDRKLSGGADQGAQPSFEEVKATLPRRPSSHQSSIQVDVASTKQMPRDPQGKARGHLPTKASAFIEASLIQNPPIQRRTPSASDVKHQPVDSLVSTTAEAIGSSKPVQHHGATAAELSPSVSEAEQSTVSTSPRQPDGNPVAISAASKVAISATSKKASPALNLEGAKNAPPSVNLGGAKNASSVVDSQQLVSSTSPRASAVDEVNVGQKFSIRSTSTLTMASNDGRGSIPTKVNGQNTSVDVAVGRSIGARETAPNGTIVQSNAASTLQHLDNLAPMSTPLTSTAGETVASAPLGQLGNIVAQVVREGNLPRTITIALEPKELGQLQLQVTSNGGEIQVHIQVADPITRGMVSQQLADLTNTLHRDLGFGGEHGGSHREPSKPSQAGLGAVPVATIEAPSGVPSTTVAHSLIDVRL